jgi:hypothetical protein
MIGGSATRKQCPGSWETAYRRLWHRRWLIRIAARVRFATRFPLGSRRVAAADKGEDYSTCDVVGSSIE